jgi:hypothetical protein
VKEERKEGRKERNKRKESNTGRGGESEEEFMKESEYGANTLYTCM